MGLPIFGSDYMNYEEAIKRTKAILDQIPIMNYVYRGADINDIMCRIENEYDHLVQSDPDCFQGLIFNWMGMDEFMDYLRDKYQISCNENITYSIGGFPDERIKRA